MLRTLCTLAAVSLTTACGSLPPKSLATPIPANLQQPCLRLSLPVGASGAFVYDWAIDTVRAYNECADKVDGLIEAWPR